MDVAQSAKTEQGQSQSSHDCSPSEMSAEVGEMKSSISAASNDSAMDGASAATGDH